MIKVITYGTYDLLHYGHIRLLERAKSLGDYLIVGVTADDFDKTRGKINVQQSLMERVEAVRATGLADKIIIEEYEGQKIDDIKRYDIDIFTVGSDWTGYFDYLNEFCKVVYLDRTQGVSSTEIRDAKGLVSLGLVGYTDYVERVANESKFVNGVKVSGICTDNVQRYRDDKYELVTDSYSELLNVSDAIYIHSAPRFHYSQVKVALEKGKHVLCESPICLNPNEYEELCEIAHDRNLVLMDSLRTAFSTAYSRMLLLIKGGKIGNVVSVDAICTTLRVVDDFSESNLKKIWGSITAWGPTALLPVFQILGTDFEQCDIVTHFEDQSNLYDTFSKISFIYKDAVASIKVGTGVKSEGELIVSGTKGYIYVPAPWWKTDYFEIRYENSANNKRYFYQLDGEGIRNELVCFLRAISKGKEDLYIERNTSKAIIRIMNSFINEKKYKTI